MKAVIKKAVGTPVIAVFFAFLLIFTSLDLLAPDKKISELENRELKQPPVFTLSSFTGNKWTVEYGEYVRDQFVWRDGWVSAYSMLELASGKLEGGGVWYAKGGYQIAKPAVAMAAAEVNTECVVQLSRRFPGAVSVMLVPSPASVLSGRLPYAPALPNENAMLDGMNRAFSEAGAHTVDLRAAFRGSEAAGRQLYYRTDHHWTTDGGALLAYRAYSAAMGRQATLPPPGLLRHAGGFLGTNYAKTHRPFTAPEEILYYSLPNQMEITRLDGEKTVTGIMDESKFAAYDKYAAFLHGNTGYREITGNGSGSVLLIKDSYGNCFAPYLVENYAKIGVIDLRAWDDIDGTIKRGGFDEVLVLYSFASFAQDKDIVKMADAKQEAFR